jgi:nicotinamide-nucleotide amidase
VSATEPLATSPEQLLNDLLMNRPDVSLSTAESCTGGGVAHRITRIAGSSTYFLGGIVSYSNDAKHRLLGVPEAVLANPGAVSEPCARLMAEGSRTAFGSAIAVSTTGIAGPGGGSERKPVGLVYIAVAGPLGTECEEHRFAGSRAEVIESAIRAAMSQLARYVTRVLDARGA